MKRLLFLLILLLTIPCHATDRGHGKIDYFDTIWDDIRIVPGAFDVPGVSDPTLQTWQPGGGGATFKVWKFAKGDEVHASFQLPHGYKTDATTWYCHVHWTPADRGNEETTATVGWKADISIASIGSNFPSTTTYDMSDACQSTDDQHLMTPEATITVSNVGISAMVMVRLYRSDTGADDTWAGATDATSPALLEFDIHIPLNTIGSAEHDAK